MSGSNQLVGAGLEQLVASLSGRLEASSLVAIDGAPGSGKSTLRQQIAPHIGAREVELDDFLVPDQNCFVDALKLDSLHRELTATKDRIVVSGACMLQILDRIGCKADVLIYVKRMAIWGWADEDELLGSQLEELAYAGGLSPEDLALHVEVRQYHLVFRPHEAAEIIYGRHESN